MQKRAGSLDCGPVLLCMRHDSSGYSEMSQSQDKGARAVVHSGVSKGGDLGATSDGQTEGRGDLVGCAVMVLDN